MQLLDILQRLKDYQGQVIRNWYVVLLFILLIAALMGVNASMRPTYYTSSTVFHPEVGLNAQGNQPNALTAILGGAMPGGESAFMIGVLRSRYISEAVAADSVEYKGEKRLLADLLLEFNPPYSSLFGWLSNLRSPAGGQMSYPRRIIIAGSLLRQSMTVETRDDGFITMNVSYYEHDLSGIISRSYVKQLGIYYKKQKTEKAARNVEFFSLRVDSVKRELDKANYGIANYSDQNRYSLFNRDNIYPSDLEVKRNMLQQMYVTLTISKEQALAQLLEDTPIIQVLDPPDPPYKRIKSSLTLYLVIGVIAGLMFGIFIVCRKMLWKDLRELVMQSLQAAPAAQGSEP